MRHLQNLRALQFPLGFTDSQGAYRFLAALQIFGGLIDFQELTDSQEPYRVPGAL